MDLQSCFPGTACRFYLPDNQIHQKNSFFLFCAMVGLSKKDCKEAEKWEIKWLYQIFYFFVFSMGVTIIQYLFFTFLPGVLGEDLAATEFMWPQIPMNIFGVEFTRSLLGYNVLRDSTTGAVMIGGGLGYFISYEIGSFVAQCINFPLQRNITFKSHGNIGYQAMWYFIAWIVISLMRNCWKPAPSTGICGRRISARKIRCKGVLSDVWNIEKNLCFRRQQKGAFEKIPVVCVSVRAVFSHAVCRTLCSDWCAGI